MNLALDSGALEKKSKRRWSLPNCMTEAKIKKESCWSQILQLICKVGDQNEQKILLSKDFNSLFLCFAYYDTLQKNFNSA